MATPGESDALTRAPASRTAALAVLCAVAALPVAVLAAVAPAAGVALVGAAAAGTAAHRHRERLLDQRTRLGRGVGAVLIAAGLFAFAGVLVGGLFAVTLWPVTVAMATIVAGILLLAWRAPAWALGAALLLFGAEGSLKILLAIEPTPLPGGYRAVGAAAIDLALFGALAGVLAADRLRTPRGVWAGASRAERWAIGLLGGWLALSVLQIPQSGDVVQGVEGFRLFQAYTAVAVGALVVALRLRLAPVLLQALLAIGGVIALYAAFRAVFGPALLEELFARSARTTSFYGDKLRALGSFSSSIGMVSFLMPIAVAGLVGGYLSPRVRPLAWGSAALAVVAILGSYGRAPLLGIAVGLLFALIVLVGAGGVSRRRKAVAGALVVVTLGVTWAGVLVASRGSDSLQERAQGVFRPGEDESLQLRFGTWERTVEEVPDHPLGRGIGTIGGATETASGGDVTTDNSFLKVLAEQGVPGVAIFVGGLLLAIVVLARRIAATTGERRALGLAALAGFVGFLALSISGEYVEQPGKVVAWAMLGLAAAAAFARPDREPGP